MCHVGENSLVSICFVSCPRRLPRWVGKYQPKEAAGNYQIPRDKETVASKRPPLLKVWRCLHPKWDNFRREETKQQTSKETFARSRESEVNSREIFPIFLPVPAPTHHTLVHRQTICLALVRRGTETKINVRKLNTESLLSSLPPSVRPYSQGVEDLKLNQVQSIN